MDCYQCYPRLRISVPQDDEMVRITRGAAVGAVAEALSLWAASLGYACLAVVWTCFMEPRPGERIIGVFLFCFAFLGLVLGSILGGVSGALGGALGGWSLGRASCPRWRWSRPSRTTRHRW